jgi:hypothetical protein
MVNHVIQFWYFYKFKQKLYLLHINAYSVAELFSISDK